MTREEMGTFLDGARQLVRDLSVGFEQRLAAIEAKDRGRDGKDGLIGPQGLKGDPGRDGLQGLMGIPGDDGKEGKAGRDGTLEHLKAVFDGERTLTLCFKDGSPIEGGVIRFAIPLYRGVYEAGKVYEKGDSVTMGGHQWIARENTATVPTDTSRSSYDRAWQLAVKAGREGKPGKDGANGKDGRDR